MPERLKWVPSKSPLRLRGLPLSLRGPCLGLRGPFLGLREPSLEPRESPLEPVRGNVSVVRRHGAGADSSDGVLAEITLAILVIFMPLGAGWLLRYLSLTGVSLAGPYETCQHVLTRLDRGRDLLLRLEWRQRPQLGAELGLALRSVERDLEAVGDLRLLRLLHGSDIFFTFFMTIDHSTTVQSAGASVAWGVALRGVVRGGLATRPCPLPVGRSLRGITCMACLCDHFYSCLCECVK